MQSMANENVPLQAAKEAVMASLRQQQGGKLQPEPTLR